MKGKYIKGRQNEKKMEGASRKMKGREIEEKKMGI